jgi:coproporphyrinogen III oxidase
MSASPTRVEIAAHFRDIQDRVVAALGRIDPRPFRDDRWERRGGGGGRSRVLEQGEVLERAGVNFSEVHGELSPEFAATLPGEGRAFYATGISLVLHPRNPFAPTVHANFRYFEKGGASWFGGGADLTPSYLFDEDAMHFHAVLKAACDRHDLRYYPDFKKGCDNYFLIVHRGERRGIGGLFFDYLQGDRAALFDFVKDVSGAFLPAYTPILERRMNTPHEPRHREWQLLRRGRYVEFNLVYDRGTVFGLKTGGRVESILMSLPPVVRWEYDYHPEPGSREAELDDVYLKPCDWASETDA